MRTCIYVYVQFFIYSLWPCSYETNKQTKTVANTLAIRIKCSPVSAFQKLFMP